MKQLDLHQIELHVPVVAWLLILGHAIFIVVAIFLFSLLAGIGVASGDQTALAVMSLIGTLLAGLLVALGLPGLVAGFGLLARKAWARVLAMVVSVLGLMNFPLGTLIGAYAIWVLLQDAAGDYFNPALAAKPREASAAQPA
jgi:hypothetical protein